MNIFIGSSGQATDQLDEIAVIVEKCNHTPILWNRSPSPFPPGRFTLESLEEMVENENIGAAIFICTSDDQTWYRNEIVDIPRDNVIFEHGLFMGKLGRTRAIIVRYDDIKLPSDLSGYTYIDYYGNNQSRGRIELRNWLKKLPENAPQHNNNVLMLPRNKIHERYSIDSRLHISDGLYKQIRNIRIMNFSSNLVINPEMAEIGHIAANDISLSAAIETIMKDTQATVELILSYPNRYNVKDLETKCATRRAGNCAASLYSALETLYRNLSSDTIYSIRGNNEPRLFFLYLMKTSMPFGIFNVEFMEKASQYNHVKVDLYSAALKTEDDRRSFVIWQTQDPTNYQFFVDNFINIKENPRLCELQTLENFKETVEKIRKISKSSGG